MSRNFQLGSNGIKQRAFLMVEGSLSSVKRIMGCLMGHGCLSLTTGVAAHNGAHFTRIRLHCHIKSFDLRFRQETATIESFWVEF